jgi:hypothetical protein
MRVFKIPFFLLVCAAVVCSTSCTDNHKKTQDVVAKIGGDYIYTFTDLQQYVSDWSYMRKFKTRSEAYREALDAMITNQLKRFDFFARGLDKDEKLIQGIRRIINEELVVEYYTAKYENKYANEEFARKIYAIMDKQVYYQQIILKVPEGASNKQVESIKKKAIEIKAKIDAGEDFGKLRGYFSKDSTSFVPDEQTHLVTWEQTISSSLDSVIFNLYAGNISVLFTNGGFHVVKVTDVQKKRIEDFNKVKHELVAKLKNAYSNKSVEEFENDNMGLIDENSVSWNKKALLQLSRWSENPKFYDTIYQDSLQKAIAKDNFIILTYSDGRVDLKEYLHLVSTILIPKSSEKIDAENFKKFILEAVRRDKIVEKAEKLGLEKNIFNAKTLNPVLKNQIARLYNLAVVDSQIPKPNDAMLKQFYSQQKDSLYYQLKKINIYAMIYSDKQKADETMHKISEGTPFEKISGQWFVKTFIRDRDGNIKSYFSPEKPFLGEAAFRTNLNETAGPVQYHDPELGEQYAIIKCVNIRPEKQLLFDDVKNSIVEDYTKYHREKLMLEVKNQLWKKYAAKTYQDVLTSKLKSS